MKIQIKKLAFIIFSLGILSFSCAAYAGGLLNNDAGNNIVTNMEGTGNAADYNTAGGTKDNLLISQLASTIITAFLGLLGIIFLIMIIIGGFNWMTAAGNSGKVEDAKATLYRGVIGLIILVSAYVITAFVFRALGGIVGAGAGR